MPRTSRRAPRPRRANTGFTVSVNRPRRNIPRRRAPGRGNPRLRMFRAPRAGGNALTIPLKCGYATEFVGTGSSFVNITNAPGSLPIGFPSMPAAWFNRYEPIFDYVRINKVKVEITCPYNIGQHSVGTQSLYQLWSKKASSTTEAVPGSLTEWLNMQNAKRITFSGRNNSHTIIFTPAFETTSQPLNVGNTQLRLEYRQWQSIKALPTEMTPHLGIIGQIHRLDGSVIGNTNVFKCNVTMYCQLKSVKQL